MTVLILPFGYSTCNPITFDMPTIKIIGAITCDAKVAGVNSCPHNAFIIKGAATNSPKVKGRHMAIVKSYDFWINLLNSSSLCSAIKLDVLGIITAPRQEDIFITTDIIFVAAVKYPTAKVPFINPNRTGFSCKYILVTTLKENT